MKIILYFIIGVLSLPFVVGYQIALWVGEMLSPIAELGAEITAHVRERFTR